MGRDKTLYDILTGDSMDHPVQPYINVVRPCTNPSGKENTCMTAGCSPVQSHTQTYPGHGGGQSAQGANNQQSQSGISNSSAPDAAKAKVGAQSAVMSVYSQQARQDVGVGGNTSTQKPRQPLPPKRRRFQEFVDKPGGDKQSKVGMFLIGKCQRYVVQALKLGLVIMSENLTDAHACVNRATYLSITAIVQMKFCRLHQCSRHILMANLLLKLGCDIMILLYQYI
jgi:hypothetical protein